MDWARAPVATGPYKVREFVPDQSLTLDAHDDYWGGRPPLKSVRLVVVPEVATRINGLLAGQFDFICDVPPDQIPGIEKNAKFEVLGSTDRQPSHHGVRQEPSAARRSAHPPGLHPRHRPPGDRRGLWSGRTRVPAGLQWEFYGPMFVENWTVPDYDPAKAKALLKDANYKGEPIPYRLLNNYYTNQVATAQMLVEMWRQAGLNVPDRDEGELAADLRDQRPARGARLVEQRAASTTRSPRSSPSTARRASSSRSANGPTRR